MGNTDKVPSISPFCRKWRLRKGSHQSWSRVQMRIKRLCCSLWRKGGPRNLHPAQLLPGRSSCAPWGGSHAAGLALPLTEQEGIEFQCLLGELLLSTSLLQKHPQPSCWLHSPSMKTWPQERTSGLFCMQSCKLRLCSLLCSNLLLSLRIDKSLCPTQELLIAAFSSPVVSIPAWRERGEGSIRSLFVTRDRHGWS